ncbi:hypothetical protein VTO42DRAFT_1463 [Malbranchea cinnamomea]
MAPKIFITGGTGYIGGTILDTLVTRHPEYEITALLRREPEGFRQRYPNIKVVRGDYDSSDLLADCAAAADVVVHNGNSDHEASLQALLAGLQRRGTLSSPAFLIHLSGTGIMADWRTPDQRGKLNPKVWSDISDISAIANRPVGELHQHTDAIIHAATREYGDRVKAAIICPPDIYGPGRGPGRTHSVLLPLYLSEIKKVGRAFYAGSGENRRSWVHIEDLMKVYLRLVEAAVAGGAGADWGKEGYYFTSSQDISQKELATAAGKILKRLGVIPDEEPQSLPLDQIDSMVPEYGIPHFGHYFFSSNSRTVADRAAKLFGYKPTEPSLIESLEADFKVALDKSQ